MEIGYGVLKIRAKDVSLQT